VFGLGDARNGRRSGAHGDNDGEAAVESALEQVLGPRVDVTSLAAGLTGAADLDAASAA
jgi:hypothetical protein